MRTRGYVLGLALARKGEVEEAITAYQKALRLKPDFAYADHALGNAHYGRGKFAEAVASYSEGIKHDPKNAAAHRAFALLLANCPDPKFRDPAQAAALARKAIELAPSNAANFSALGLALYRAGDWQGTLDALNESRALRKVDDPQDGFFRAMAHWRLEQREDGIDWYVKCAGCG